MSTNESRYRDALARIAEVASAAIDHPEDQEEGYGGNGAEHEASKERSGCTLRALPTQLLVKAAETATQVYPINAPLSEPTGRVATDIVAAGLVADPLRIAVLTTKYWGPTPRRLTVSFIDTTSSELRRRIVSHLNAWNKAASIQFVETQGTGMVRISRGPGGYWSYLGTDILHIAPNRPTMNLEAFTMSTPESEYRRVVRHEAGHTLGMPHEHMRRSLVARIDPEKAYAYFRRTQGWDRATVDQQVLTPLDERTILGTPADQTSIMAYQLPGSITRDGRPIVGGRDINATDLAFAGRIYPKPGPQQETEPAESYGDAYEQEGFVEEVETALLWDVVRA